MTVHAVPTAADWLADATASKAAVDALIGTNAASLQPTALAIVGGILAEAAAAVAPVAAKLLGGAAGGPPGLASTVLGLLGNFAATQLSAHTTAVTALPSDQQALVEQLLPQVVALVQAELVKLLPAAPVSLPPA